MTSRKANSLPIIGSQELFVKLWAKHEEIECYGACGHAVCQECGEIDVERDRLDGRTDPEAREQRAILDARAESHAEEHLGERKYAEDAWYQGETYSERITTIRIDAPTQHQFDLPRQRKVARDVVKSLDTATRWASKITGAQVAGAGMFAFVARAALGGGPNLVATVLMVVLGRLAASGYHLGLRLMLILDNTTGENKCNAIIIVLAWLVYWDKFRETGFFCQLVGHTYNELDQSFNALIQSMLQYAVYTVSMMVGYIFKFLASYGIRDVIVLHHLWDFSGQLLPHAYPLGGFATSQHGDGMHEFRLKKDGAGVVRLHMRKSSQSSGWLPEGPGYEVFKTPPPSASEILAAAFKLDSAWKRKEVEEVIRQWIPFMAVDDTTRKSFEQEWTDDYFSLPFDMQPSQLPPEKQMTVPDLPLLSDAAAANDSSSALIRNPSARLENPDVNPTHGGAAGHRTATDVRNDTAAYRQGCRLQATALPPVFQSDFLLVQLPGVPLALHSVCGHALLSTATYEHLRFSTVEYTHTQQEGFAGLWGTFAKTENQTYNPQDKKSGTKFIRHAGIGRDHVVVYNVQVFVDHSYDEKPLRVSVESLKQLARARPNEFAMPDSIPTSHGQQRPADDSSEEEDDDESSSEDPPPPIPHGFVAYAWQEGSSVNEFLLWSKLRGQRNPTWHRGLVDKILDPNRAGGFTHNAKFDGEPHPRGTTLTAAAVDEGVLVLMRPAVAAPAPAQAPAAARRQRPRR